MASSFGVAEALEVFQTIDAGGNGRLSKHELQTYCSENFIKWADVYTALSLDKMIIVSRASFLAAAEQGKLGVFQGKGNPGRTARNLDQTLVEKLEKASTIAGDADAKKAIENLIAHVQSQDPKFTELRMVNNTYLISLPDDEREDIYARFIAALKASKFVTDIYIANCGLNDKVGVKFAQLLLTNTTIQDLSLEQCDIRETGMAAFADALSKTTTLLELRLKHQFKPNIPTPTIHAFVEAIEKNGVTTMCSINQRDKSLKIRFNRALAKNTEAARQRVQEKWVKAGRPGETLNAVQKEIETLPTATMAKLSYKDNPLFEAMGARWINEIFPEKLGANKSINHLDLSGLELTDEFAAAFARDVLKPDTALERLDLSRNSFSGTGLAHIAKKIGFCGLFRIKLTSQKIGFTKQIITSDAEAELVEACRVSETLSTCNVDWKQQTAMRNAERELMTNIREARFKKMAGKV